MRRALLIACALVAVALTSASPVAAQTGASLVVRSLDNTKAPNVKAVLQYTGPLTSAVKNVTVRENGRLVPDVKVVPLSEAATSVGVVVVLDTSGSMRSGNRINLAKQAVADFVAGRGANEQIALVTFSDIPRVIHGFSADNGAAEAVASQTAAGETALWDAISLAVGLFHDRPDVQPNVLVLSDGTDSVSKATAADAKAAAQAAHVSVSAIGLTGAGYDGSELASIAAATGGRFQASTKAADLAAMFNTIRQDLNQQFQVSWTAKDVAPEVSFQLQGAIATGAVPKGGASEGSAVRPKIVAGGHSLFSGSAGRMMAILLFGCAGLAAAFGIALVATERTSPIRSRLALYGSPSEVAKATAKRDGEIASTEFVRKAVEWTSGAGRNIGLNEWIEKRLAVARLPLRAAEAAFFTLAFAFVVGVAMFVLKGVLIGILAFVLIGGTAALALQVAAIRSQRRFVKQLPSALQLLASSLRAGYSLLQGCESVANEMGGPFSAELKRVLSEARLGRPLEEALELASDRVDCPDFTWVVMAINIQREVGGNLAELLDTVAETMRARSRLRGEVKALTAEGRASAVILGIMPPALGAAMAVMSPGYLDPLFHETIGRMMLGGSALMAIGGFFWMQKIIKVDL